MAHLNRWPKEMTATSTLSVRARQALGAAAVEAFCRTASISDASVDHFVAHLWSLACARDIPRWEEEGRSLAITGRGDPLPAPLIAMIGSESSARLARITELACEISLSQIFGASRPAQSDEFLVQTLAAAGVGATQKEVPSVLGRHAGGVDGWGEAVDCEDLPDWKAAAREFVGGQK